MPGIHHSPFAGSWYPADPHELNRLMEGAWQESRTRTGVHLLPNPIAFVVPHAGLQYSGTVAAAAYRYIEAARPARIVLLGFAHRGGPPGISIPEIDTFQTPMGLMQVDAEATAWLLSQPGFHYVAEESVCDHSVEIQLPLLQRAAPHAMLLPLYVGSMTGEEEQEAARALASLAGAGTLFVASSDLTHYGQAFAYEPFPPGAAVWARLAELDRDIMDGASGLDAGMFRTALRESGSNACGRAPIALLLRTLSCLPLEEIFQARLDYQTSGELTGDFRHSVSYGALGYFPASSFELSREDGNRLLASARATLEHHAPVPPSEVTSPLTRRAGVFVTLRHDGQLRGCIGTADGHHSLAEDVPAMALSAAREDPRFEPVTAGEPVEVEISLLSPYKRIGCREPFRLGEHGAHLEFHGCCSLLLPQVARTRDWSAERFWTALAAKAGLPPDVYLKPKTRLHVFRAQSIG